MKFIKGITFAPFYRKNTLNTEQARESFDYMIENTGADFVILAPGGLQDTAQKRFVIVPMLLFRMRNWQI
mgnify:CR=1 FL=1